MSDEYNFQNIHRYTRTTYKNGRSAQGHEARPPDPPGGCSCDLDPEPELANILHKKCPVISLAQQQLNRLLDETDRIMSDNHQSCRTCYDLFCICRELVMNNQRLLLLFYIAAMFLTGLVIGAASCGSYLGKFNSPILSCIENLFLPDQFLVDGYYSVV